MWQFVLIVAVIYFFFRWKGAEALLKTNNDPRVHHNDAKNSHQNVNDKNEKEDYIDYEEID